MDGGASIQPSMRRHSNKRTFSEMSASHRGASSPARDEHYGPEHAARRQRRFEDQLRFPGIHFPGDGLDYRRPVMSTSQAAQSEGHVNERGGSSSSAAVIDLTAEDGLDQPHDTEHAAIPAAASATSRHAQRLPRFGRNVIDVESSGSEDMDTGDGDDEEYNPTLPGIHYLGLPQRQPRPQYAGLRRPARPRSPLPDVDDVQFIEQRARSRPRLRSLSPSSTPRPQRNATPYPTGLGETIDLTVDNDDDIVHLDTRPREGVNNAPPEPAADAGARTFADRGFEHMGNLVNLLREGGANVGGRLYQRIQNFAGQGDLQAHGTQQPVFLGFEQHQTYVGHVQRAAAGARRGHHHHHHHHHHHNINHDRRRRHHHDARAGQGHHAVLAQAVQIRQNMEHMMDYAMTAFDMGHRGGGGGGGGGGRGGHRPPTPKYEAPPAAEPGFTRSPEDDEVVVCPNCGDELATGGEGPKQEVWVVKTCGHAYCGECAQNRSRPANKKGKAPALDDRFLPPPFKKCVVEGCGKPASKTSMIHVYLGS